MVDRLVNGKNGSDVYAKKAEEIGRDAPQRKLNEAILQPDKNCEFLLLLLAKNS